MSENLFVLNRSYVLATKKGHIIEFKKDVPTFVPPMCRREVSEIGAVPAVGSANVIEDEKKPTHPVDPTERAVDIIDAIDALVALNVREDFTAAGSPTVEAVSREVGYKVQAKEIAAQWQEYHDRKADK